MKTVKHILTWDCPNKCPYCINDKLGVIKQHKIASSALLAYEILAGMGVESIIMSGGEPTLCDDLSSHIRVAHDYFDHVSMITMNKDVMSGAYNHLDLDDVMFSPHTDNLWSIPDNLSKFPTYAMLMEKELKHHNYEKWATRLMLIGYSGMTLHQLWPHGSACLYLIPTYANFSVRYKDKEACLKGLLLTPDLRLIDGSAFFE
jgi:uncharacterized radical SAM superfamily Fe-S cluster-containing enzyme